MKAYAISMLISLAALAGAANALPGAPASLTLWMFEPVGAGSASAVGTQLARPIGTASGGKETTFVLENLQTRTGLVSSNGQTVVATATTTFIETVVASASGWAQSNFLTTTTGTELGGALHCFFTGTASRGGECVQEEVHGPSTTATRTLSGPPIPDVFRISAGSGISSGAASVSSRQQTTVTAVSTSTSTLTSQATASATSPTSSSAPASATNTANAAISTCMLCGFAFGEWRRIVSAIAGGTVVGAWMLL